jgi:hypothetical protein
MTDILMDIIFKNTQKKEEFSINIEIKKKKRKAIHLKKTLSN